MALNALSFALGRPSFGGGLFQVGQQAGAQGAMPGYNASVQAAQEQERALQGGLLGMASTVENGATPEQVAAMQQGLAGMGATAEQVTSARNTGTANAEQLQQQQQAALKEKGKQSIASIIASQDVSNPNVLKAIQTVAMRTGVPADELPKMMGTTTPWKVVGNTMFNTDTGDWSTPPKSEDIQQLTLKDIAKLKETYTNESVNNLMDNPKAELVFREGMGPKGADAPTEEGGPSRAVFVATKLAAVDELLSTADQAKAAADNSAAFGYDLVKMAPWPTEQRALSGYVDTLKANLTFDKLQAIRSDPDNKTGGALGQVSDREGQLLSSAVAALDPAAGDKVFKQQMDKVTRHYNNFKRSLLNLPPQAPEYVTENGQVFYRESEGNWVNLGAIE